MQMPFDFRARPNLKGSRIRCNRGNPFLPEKPQELLRRLDADILGFLPFIHLIESGPLFLRHVFVLTDISEPEEDDVPGPEVIGGEALVLDDFQELGERDRMCGHGVDHAAVPLGPFVPVYQYGASCNAFFGDICCA